MTPLRLVVKELRQAKGWTQQELADAAGISRVTVNRIESDRNNRIDFTTLEQVARALRVEPGRLIQRTDGKRRRT